MANKLLGQAFSQLDITKKDKDYLIPATLGFLIQGIRTVEVSGRPNYVYARIRGNLNEVVQVFNDKVSPVYDLPVLLVRDPNNPSRYKVDGRDIGRYENWGSMSSYLPKHGNQHSFVPNGGGDIVWVYSQQFVPLLLYPSGTSGSDVALINGYSHYDNGTWSFIGGTGTASLLTYKPTGTSSRMVLVYMDDSGNPQLSPGDFFSSSVTGSISVLPFVPALPNNSIPVGAIRLVSGTSTIGWDNIYDLRPFYEGGAGSTGTMSGHTIQDDGVSQTTRVNLNFVGSGFTVYDDAGNNATLVSGTYGSNADTLDGFHANDLNRSKIQVWDVSAASMLTYAATADGLITAFGALGASDVVYLPPVTFTMTTGVSTPSGVTILGSNLAKTMLYRTTAGTVLTLGASNNVENLRVYAEGSNASTSCIAVDASAGNCYFVDDWFFGINSNGSGSAYGLYGGGSATCLDTMIGAFVGAGFTAPYNTRPRGILDITYPASTSHRLSTLTARLGSDTNYIEFLDSGMIVSGSKVRIGVSIADVSNPPTLAELNTAFGSAAVVGAGFIGLLNDAGGGTNEYLVTSDGANFFYSTLTKAT